MSSDHFGPHDSANSDTLSPQLSIDVVFAEHGGLWDLVTALSYSALSYLTVAALALLILTTLACRKRGRQVYIVNFFKVFRRHSGASLPAYFALSQHLVAPIGISVVAVLWGVQVLSLRAWMTPPHPHVENHHIVGLVALPIAEVTGILGFASIGCLNLRKRRTPPTSPVIGPQTSYTLFFLLALVLLSNIILVARVGGAVHKVLPVAEKTFDDTQEMIRSYTGDLDPTAIQEFADTLALRFDTQIIPVLRPLESRLRESMICFAIGLVILLSINLIGWMREEGRTSPEGGAFTTSDIPLSELSEGSRSRLASGPLTNQASPFTVGNETPFDWGYTLVFFGLAPVTILLLGISTWLAINGLEIVEQSIHWYSAQ